MKKCRNLFLKLLTVLLISVIVFTMAIPSFADGETPWEVSKSKTATALDENGRTTVTLSLPAADYEVGSDIVFVLDKSESGNTDAAKEAIKAMLEELVKKQGIDIKVGIVIFNKNANISLPLTQLTAENLSKIQAGIDATYTSGTNVQAGIKAGTAMLDADTTVSAENKHLVLVTDGISHIWGDGENLTTIYTKFVADSTVIFAGTEPYLQKVKQGTDASFSELATIAGKNDFDLPFGLDTNTLTPEQAEKLGSLDKDCPSAVERAVYLSSEAYKEAASKYHVTSVYWANPTYPVATEFMQWTAQLGEAYCADNQSMEGIFDAIQKQIVYVIGSGVVTDVIGEDFDLTDIHSLHLTLAGETLEKKVEENTVSFGTPDAAGVYPYVVTYQPEGEKGETLVWEINVPVEIIERVELSYQLTLINRATKDGTYEVPTNESAILDYVDSNGKNPGSEVFEKPTVKYSVEGDEYEYEYEPKEDEDTDTNKPTNPSTGDSNGAVLGLGLFGVSATVLCFTMRKKKR